MFRPRAAPLGSEGSANSPALCVKRPALPGLPTSTLLDPVSSKVCPSGLSLDWGSEGQGPLRTVSVVLGLSFVLTTPGWDVPVVLWGPFWDSDCPSE